MQEEWYEPSPRTKRRAAAFFATPEGKKALERYDKIINSVPDRQNSSAEIPSELQMSDTEHPMK